MLFCDIKTPNDLAEFLDIELKKLTYILYIKKVSTYYEHFTIVKKNGGLREIHAPTGDLKSIQKRLANELYSFKLDCCKKENTKVNISHGFEKGKSIITNARIHRNKRYILNIDLLDFFDSFHFGRVKGYFMKNKYLALPDEIATIIAQLCCFGGKLPQGAPTSPIITNLICQILDFRILKISKKYKLDYTRYADDLTFSTNDKNFIASKDLFLKSIQMEIERAGFKINEKKKRLEYKDSRQSVTGLVVNKKVNVSQDYYRQTRAMAHALYKTKQFSLDGQSARMEQLEGRFTFINQISWYNNKLDEKKHDFRYLSGREKEFKKFLFFKFFYGNSAPIVITEGKTDERYLKAALKSLYKEYPALITKSEDQKYEFHFSFFRRTRKTLYFLGIQPDGADTLQNIYKYFRDTNDSGFPNYYEYFKRISVPSIHPVILLFDNELQSDRPLKKFLQNSKLPDKRKDIENNLFIELVNQKLYLLTNPLVKGMPESEIEQLFSDETLNYTIDGKKLCLKENFDTQKYYGSHFQK